jgi:2-phospho-L-lactate/phosphoenolpyruvate guanylyltransferase
MNGSATAILPVKRLTSAKQRLAESLPPAARAELAEAMFLDVLTAIGHCRRIGTLIVVAADPKVARTARWLGADVVRQEEDVGHSEAALAGVRGAISTGAERVVLLAADCPMLDPEEIDRHLGAVPRSAQIVPDRHGTGTNALFLSPPDAFAPGFGPGSAARHVGLARQAGVAFSLERIESLALDVDTPEDLALLREALVLDPASAPRTARLVWELIPDPDTAEPATA